MPENYDVQPLGGFDMGAKLEKVSGTLRTRQRQTEMLDAAQQVIKEGTPEDISVYMVKYPEMAKTVQDAVAAQNGATVKEQVDWAKNILINGADPAEASSNLVKELDASQRDATEAVDTLGEAVEDPAATKVRAEKVLALYAPAEFKTYTGAMSGPEGVKPTSEITNYKFAKAQGFEGSILDFQAQLKGEAKTTAIKEFEYAEKNPAFALKQQEKIDAKDAKETAGKDFKNIMDLRKEFLKQSGEYQKVRDAYTRVQKSTKIPTAAGDLSLIFNYMKMLDPGSTVREGEFQTAAASGSYGERFKASAQKIMSGERLSPKMRDDFVSKSKELLSGMESQHSKRVRNYSKIAKSNKFPVDEVVVDITAPIEDEPIAGQQETPTVSTQEDFDSLPSGAIFVEDGKQYRKP